MMKMNLLSVVTPPSIYQENNVENVTLGKEPNYTLAYDLGLEHHHTIMSTLGETRVRLEREIYSRSLLQLAVGWSDQPYWALNLGQVHIDSIACKFTAAFYPSTPK